MSRRTKAYRLLFGLLCALATTAAQAVTVIPGPSTCTGGGCAYITNYGSNSVSVIDTSSDAVVATIPVGTGPYGVAVSSDGSRVYVTNYVGNSVSVIDSGSNTVIATVPIATRPYGLAVSPNGRWVYVAAYYSNNVSVIDTATNAVVAVVPVGQRPHGIAVNRDNTRVYVANYATNNVSVIDVASNTVLATIALPAGSNPMGLTIRPDGSRLYVTGYGNNTLYEIDAASNTVVANVPTGNHPWGVAVSPDQRTIYVANYNGSASVATSVSVIDAATYAVTSVPLPLGAAPIGVTVNPNGWPVYVASYSDGKVYAIDTYTNTVIDTIGVGLRPYAFGAFMTPPPVSAWDFTPPIISNMLPLYGSAFPAPVVPKISAQYSNPATGIDLGSVALMVDGVDVTAQSLISATGISYTPSTLGLGSHYAILKVADKYGLYSSFDTRFYITSGPRIFGLMPPDGTIFAPGPPPSIQAQFVDNGPVDLTSIHLLVDGQDVTAQSLIDTASPSAIGFINGLVAYTPPSLAAGPHTAKFTLSDTVGFSATASWSFTTSTGIRITPASPLNGQHVTDPRTSVSAAFADTVSTINLGLSKFLMDGVDVTAGSQMVANGINFVPLADWTVGPHTANLTLFDTIGSSTNATWTFTYDPAPGIYDETPRDVYVAVPNPAISVFLMDNGSGVNLGATTITLDGTDMTAQAIVTASHISLATSGLAPGTHTVAVHTASSTGQPADKQWTFTVIALPAPATMADGVRTPRTFNPSIKAQ